MLPIDGELNHEMENLFDFRRHRISWRTNPSTGIVRCELPTMFRGRLVNIASQHRSTGADTYTLKLIDELESDVLQEVGSLVLATNSVQRFLTGSATVPVFLSGRITLEITHSAAISAQGTLLLLEHEC